MPGKRKRTRPGQGTRGDEKRRRVSGSCHGASHDSVVKTAVLAQYYPRVVSLREYLLSKLPSTSKVRRKKIQTLGRSLGGEAGERHQVLTEVLDKSLVGVLRDGESSREERWQQWTAFSQKADISVSTLANTTGLGLFSHPEIVDFVIWLLLSKAPSGRVQHLLCQGFRKDVSSRAVHRHEHITSGIPGFHAVHPNSHVAAMKDAPWPQVLALLGKEGERVMIDLILDCGIFLPVKTGRGNYHQLSGEPLGELKPFTQLHQVTKPVVVTAENIHTSCAPSAAISASVRTPGNIVFVRNRILYARAALNAKGGVAFGLRHIHVLNRYPYRPEDIDMEVEESSVPRVHPSTVHVMMYMFPRQFGLHNVFTHNVDHRETVQPFKDYTLREDEINKIYPPPSTPKIPKRLRGKAVALVQKLQTLHKRCPYKQLLEHYCPVLDQSRSPAIPDVYHDANKSISILLKSQLPIDATTAVSDSSSTPSPPRKVSIVDHATSTSQVSAFCRAVLARLVPHEFWGSGETRMHNEKVICRNIDRFISLRRFESLSLHEASQGTKFTRIEWLAPPESLNSNLSQSDARKRLEIMHEFIYYVFDSILIPLIRTNFHVTESNIYRYRLLYFRQDVWRAIAEPEMASLKLKMFEEVSPDKAQNILNSRTLGFSQVRLLPKETGVRPIMNLRRRQVSKGSRAMLGSSINTILAPIYNVLTLERVKHPHRMGSTLFSVGDLYLKLKSFQSSMQRTRCPLYFAKVDVKAAFDTIPQDAVLRLMSLVPSEEEYRIAKHVEMKPSGAYLEGDVKSKPIHKWAARAKAVDEVKLFRDDLESKLAVERKDTIFVDNVVTQVRDTDELLRLLAEHIKNNMVKIGKKYYRQKEGIPQGSILSSLLCNYFYADLEMRHLQFLHSDGSLLLRLIDDFLLITAKPSHARRFLQVMHDGLPEYGVRVNPDKTLANFEATVNGKKISRLVGSRKFPYCGSFIDTKTLNLSKDRDRNKSISRCIHLSNEMLLTRIAIADSLTVEYSKMPGRTFHRKALNMFKIQSHAMFFDTSLNSKSTVLLNIYTAFVETATKMWSYARCLPTKKQPTTKLFTKAIQDVIDLAFMLLRSKSRKKSNKGFKCAVSKMELEWLAVSAFWDVLQRKQSKYGSVLTWLNNRRKRTEVKDAKLMIGMKRMIRSEISHDDGQ